MKKLGFIIIMSFTWFSLKAQDDFKVDAFNYESDTVFVKAREQLRTAAFESDTALMAEAHYDLGRYFFEAGSFEQALDHFIDAEKLVANNIPDNFRAYLYSNIGTTYYYTLDTASSLKYLYEANRIFLMLNNQDGLADVYGRLGHHFEKKGNYSAALDYQYKALEAAGSVGDSVGTAYIFENIGSIYEDMEDYGAALEYFLKAKNLIEKANDPYRLANILNNIGDVHRKSGNFKLGLSYSHNALNIALKYHLPYLAKSAYRDISKSFSAMNRPDSALIYLENAYDQSELVFSSDVAKQIAKNQVIYETEKKESLIALKNSEIDFLEREKLLGRWLQFFLLITLLIIAAVGYYVYRSQQNKIRNTKLILAQREDLNREKLHNAKLQEAKLRAELENKKLREIYLNDQLELRSNELTSQTLKIIRKNKLLDELKDQLSTGAGGANNQSRIKHLIDKHIRVDKNWENFQDLFEKVHGDFYKKLMDRAPDLSPAEIRLCCLLKLNIPNKDMAAMLGISPDSLRIARYRLRKKLSLEPRENLNAYVIRL